jgi:hypothetical protein
MWAFFVLLLLRVLRLMGDVLHPLLLVDGYLTDENRRYDLLVVVFVFVASYLFNWLQCRK